MPNKRMPNNVELGFQGQEMAERFLLSKGFRLVQRNFRCRLGEIDLIFSAGGENQGQAPCLVFVEVKYRRSLRYGYPREAVGIAKQRKLRQVAQFYLMRYGIANQDVRFDVVEVLDTPQGARIEHIENAF